MLAALTLTGCAGRIPENDVSGKGYVYEKGGFPDKFGIRLYKNGEFTYYEGFFSSYVGYGNWTLEGDTLILTENPDSSGHSRVFRFKVDGDTLGYIAEGSDSFIYVNVSDGEKFILGELDGFPY